MLARAFSWVSWAIVTLGVFSSVSSTPVAEYGESIELLAASVSKLLASDTEMKSQMTQAVNSLVESQNTLQKIWKGSAKIPHGVRKEEGADGDQATRAVADEILTVLREVGSKGNYSNSGATKDNVILEKILEELKNLNSNFQKHLNSLACPPPFVMIGDECYNVILEDMSWQNARNTCLTIGADLAQPSNVTALKEYVGHRYPRKNRRNFWIGGVYQEKEWKWLSGDLLEDGYWHTNEPSGNGACLAMFDGWENPFTDFPCENERRAICKRL